jgi:hypothetical protein
VELIETREIANARRKIMLDESPPTFIATKFPGLHKEARSPMLMIIWWYWPTFLLLTIGASS